MAQNVGKIIEYRDVPENGMAKRTILDRKTKGHREYVLSKSTAGYECAGSMARWTDGFVSVTFEDGGATNGQRFLIEHEQQARELFAKWTTPATS